jgi:hypothetical protein
MYRTLIVVGCLSLLVACESTYYNTMEKLGIEKRDILIDRIEDTQEAQEDTQEQFQSALEQYRAVVSFDGGNLEKLYDKLNGEFQDSEAAAENIAQRIRAVEDVSEDLFKEWEQELSLIKNARLRQSSANQLRDTRYRCQQMIKSMWRAEQSVHPVLDTLRDQVYYLKHNLNARAIASLEGELGAIDADVSTLIQRMQQSINEANAFIAAMKQ